MCERAVYLREDEYRDKQDDKDDDEQDGK